MWPGGLGPILHEIFPRWWEMAVPRDDAIAPISMFVQRDSTGNLAPNTWWRYLMSKRIVFFSLLVLFGLGDSFAFAQRYDSQIDNGKALQVADQVQALVVRFYPLLLAGALCCAIYWSLVAIKSALVSAKWSIDDFVARRAVTARLATAALILVLACIGWSTYRADTQAARTIQVDQEIVGLQLQEARLSHADNPRVIELTDQADALARGARRPLLKPRPIRPTRSHGNRSM